MSLHELQRRFIASLRDGLPPADGASPAGMAVHANNYRGQLADALRDTYEKTHLWLGDEAFDNAVDPYIDAHMPRSWTLDTYGDAFAEHLDAMYPDDGEVAELAWLDATLRRAFSGADAEPIDAAVLAHADWDRAGFCFVPTLTFRHVRTNVVALWRALDDGGTPPAVVVSAEKGGVRVWRRGLTTHFASMTALECDALDLALGGATFAEVCTLLVHRLGEDAAQDRAGELLRDWLADGLVVALE